MPRVFVGADPAVTPATDEAATPTGPRLPLLSQPSTWSAIWAIGALVVLGIIRGELRRRSGA